MPAPFTDTSKGYPYILGTQNASLIDDWALQLATKLNDTIPMAIAAGSATLNISAAATATVAITFPASRFSVAPIVMATITNAVTGATKLIPRVTTATTSGANIVVYTGDGTNATATGVTIGWIAIQMLPASAAG